VELQRELKAGDVFQAGSGWEAFLTQRCYEKLISGEHAKDLKDLYDQTVRGAVMDSVKRVNNWTVDARKFRVDFPDVAPRAAGSIWVELSWDELKPYLASSFDPAMLPQPLKRDVR
jgi:hypothetical protein